MAAVTPRPAGIPGRIAAHALGVLVCIGVPALVTAIAPVSWVDFERRDGRVLARARTCLLFVVPFRTATVDPVLGVADRRVAGTERVERRPGRDRRHRSEDQGFLVLRGADREFELPVSPHSLPSARVRAEAYLRDPAAGRLRLFAAANWKFSVGAGGAVSLLTVAYAAGLLAALVRGTAALLRRLAPGVAVTRQGG